MGRIGTSNNAVHALIRCFCHVVVSGDLSDPMVATLRGASRDVVTVYACWNMKGRFLRCLALPRAGLLMQFFYLG